MPSVPSPVASLIEYSVDQRQAAGEGPAIEQSAYEALAAFRVEIRRFFTFSRYAIESVELAPVQYQAMLAIKAHRDIEMSITRLSAELFIKVQTAVELVDRMVEAGLVTRSKSSQDRRRSILTLTLRAERELEALAAMHLNQLQVSVPDFISILSKIASSTSSSSSSSARCQEVSASAAKA